MQDKYVKEILMEAVKDIESIDKMVEQFSVKGTLTNNYLLADAYETHLEKGELYMVKGRSNAGLLVAKDGFYRLYYYLNDFNERMASLPSQPVVLEIIYRGEAKRPADEMAYWEKSGFRQHLTRDNMMASFGKMTLPESLNPRVTIAYTETVEEVSYARELLQGTLDRYTGDQLNMEELLEAARNKNLLIANWEGELAGFLRFYVKNNVAWLGHIAVHEKFRGKGIANKLVKTYIQENANGANTRYQLWVIQNNTGAVRLYQKFGFIYGNKSSASMLKM